MFPHFFELFHILRFMPNCSVNLKDRHKNLWVGLIVFFISDPSTIFRTYGADRINRIDWIYCFLGFQTKPRKSHPALSGKRKLKRMMVLLPNVHVASLFCFYSQMNSFGEGYRFLPFFRKGKKILKILKILVCQAKPGQSCRLKGAYHVNCPFDM